MRDKVVGRGKQVAGKAKEVTSRWIGDERTAAEGRNEQVQGKTRSTKGGIKSRIKKFVDRV